MTRDPLPTAWLEPARVQAVLLLLFGERVDEAEAEAVAAMVRGLSPVETGWRSSWSVGEALVRFHGRPGEALHPGLLGCACDALRPVGACLHVLAVLTDLAARHEQGRRWFEVPDWELCLTPLLAPPPAAAAPGAEARHEGFIRTHLVRDPAAREPALAWRMVREVQRLGLKDGLPLKPQPCPETWEAVAGMVRGLRPADAALHQLIAEHQELVGLHASRWQALSGRARGALRRLADRIVEALADVEEVWFEGERVTVERAPVWPMLRAEADGEGGLRLRWSPPARACLDLGSGLALLEGGRLRPLAPGYPERLARALGARLPGVPAGDVGAFLRRMVMDGGLPVDLAEVEDLPVLEPESRRACLTLDEQGACLIVGLRFAYLAQGLEVLAEPAPGAALLPLPGDEELWVRRDPAWEQERLQALAERLPEGLPARLQGEAALDFLARRLPALARDHEVRGGERLLAHRLRGTLTPRLQVRAGQGWFELDARFEIGDQAPSLQAVMEAWLAGQALVRLADGSLARLPEAWLARHGATLEELAELRRARRAGLGPEALPLARALLEEAEGEAARAWRQRLQDLEATPPPFDSIDGFTASLRSYQIDGVRWMRWMGAQGLSVCLADDMGLGKTVQALAVLAAAPRGRPHLVVAPGSVVENWAEEAARFAPGLHVHLHHGPRRGAIPEGVDLVITSHALLRQDQEVLCARPWGLVVLDEAQVIKNPASRVSRAARALEAERRVALTGTPMENSLGELHSLFSFLMPGLLGGRAAFMRRYGAGDAPALARLRERVRPFMLRRLKRDVASELPPRQDILLRCELGPAQRALYDGLLRACRDTLARAMAEEGAAAARLHALTALTRLRQACCDPALLPRAEGHGVVGSAKLDLLMELLDSALAEGHRCLVFSQWPSFLDRVAARLEARGVTHLVLTGKTTGRQALVHRWNAPDGPPVFLVSLMAGGVGLTLTGADHVILLDPWWNPAVEAQATDRAHRIGQTRPVTVYRLVARDTVEERVVALQARKRALFTAALDEGGALEDRLSAEDIARVFAEE